MKSISGNNWEELNFSKRVIEKVKIDHNFSDIQSKLIISRKFTDTEIYSIKNNLEFKNPFLLNQDFLKASNLLKKTIDHNKKILIFGDYDVDGCVSVSIMFNFLKKNKAKVSYYIPNRFNDGYGASKITLIRLFKKNLPELIIFLDCGSNSHDALSYIKKLKIKTIIIDHHNIQKPYPKTDVLINPKKECNYIDQNYLCSAFLTYLFLDQYIRLNKSKLQIKDDLIYVLLATITDVMPLRGINRLLAQKVLKEFKIIDNFVINNLFKINNIQKKIELEDFGFYIGPIFNSAGRIDDANQIVELLTTNSKDRILEIINKINKLNIKRKLIEKDYFDQINFDDISKQRGIIFLYEKNISEGIIGIIASKIKEYFNKPCIVLTNSENVIKGSARSTTNFNIGNYISNAVKKDYLLKGGGHNLAAGVTLSISKLEIFKNYLNNIYLKDKKPLDKYFISKISLSSINKDFIKSINILGPFGNYNSNPIFLLEKVRFQKQKIIKNKFISCYIKKDNKMIKAISFNHINSKISYNIMNSKNDLNALIMIKENNWKNKNSVQLEIIDLIRSSINT